jgi:2-polyprenyl-6-methoxyphenol hydroxylase-like FAD-dependent oxidoreductase
MTLRVAVVGAGITGLTVAAALARDGATCAVFDRASRFRAIGAGIQLSPNGSRLLHRLGLGAELDRVAVRPEAIEVRRWADNEVLSRTELGACERIYGAAYYTVHRADLHRMLLDTVGDGTVALGRRCVGVTERADRVELAFSDGTTETADVVIGADGARSTVRGQLCDLDARPTGQAVFRAVVGADRLPDLARENVVIIWVGPQWCVSYPVAAGKAVAFAASVPAGDWQAESWSKLSDVDALLEAFRDWNPVVRELISAPEEASRVALYDRPTIPPWSGTRTMLIGDAAHPTLLYGAQGASQGIEDALALAAHLRGSTVDSVPEALRRYETARRPRMEQVHRFIDETERNHHVNDGPAPADAGLRQREFLFGFDPEDLG